MKSVGLHDTMDTPSTRDKRRGERKEADPVSAKGVNARVFDQAGIKTKKRDSMALLTDQERAGVQFRPKWNKFERKAMRTTEEKGKKSWRSWERKRKRKRVFVNLRLQTGERGRILRFPHVRGTEKKRTKSSRE